MGITIVTTTTGRPGCFSLLEKWVARQTRKFDQWLVVGEDLNGYRFTMGQQVITRERKENETLPSICENWLRAIPEIKYDYITIWEDDDWFHPDYLATVTPLLDNHRLAGVKGDLYYKLPIRKYQMMGNTQHASLTCTAFRPEMLPFIERCKLHKSVFIDMYLWAEGTQDNSQWALIPNKAPDGRALHLGLKLMPGAVGLGNGHSDSGAPDPNFEMLRRWIGAEDACLYRQIPKTAPPTWMPDSL